MTNKNQYQVALDQTPRGPKTVDEILLWWSSHSEVIDNALELAAQVQSGKWMVAPNLPTELTGLSDGRVTNLRVINNTDPMETK